MCILGETIHNRSPSSCVAIVYLQLKLSIEVMMLACDCQAKEGQPSTPGLNHRLLLNKHLFSISWFLYPWCIY